MKPKLKQFTVDELRRELDRRTPYVFSTDLKTKINISDIEKWFQNEYGDDDFDLNFWVYKKSEKKCIFTFGFISELPRMYFTRSMVKKDGVDLFDYDYTREGGVESSGYTYKEITEEEMKTLRKFGNKYHNWTTAQKIIKRIRHGAKNQV